MSAHGGAIGQASGSRRVKDRAFHGALLVAVGISILLLGVLLVDVVLDGVGRLNWDFITSFTSIDSDKAGIQAALWGTIWLMGVCALFVIPVGVATAIYLEEYADDTKWYNRLIYVNIQNLASTAFSGSPSWCAGSSISVRSCWRAGSRSACSCCPW